MKKLALLGRILLLLTCLSKARAIPETSLQESSDSYLRNVVSELQILNGVVPSIETDGDASSAPALAASSTSSPAHTVRYLESILNRRQQYQQQQQALALLPNYDLQPEVASNNPVYLDDTPPRKPMILGFTAAELAAMYKKAIERGTPMKYNSLVNMLNYYTPKFVDTQYELPESVPRPYSEDSQYAYYFYPLHSFHHELKNYGYKTLPNFHSDTTPAENTKKETSSMNPILVGISSFLGMALLFMLSLFFYPRLMHLMHFPFVATSRMTFENEFSNLAAFVIEAIDHYNKNLKKKSKRSPFHSYMKNYQVHQKR